MSEIRWAALNGQLADRVDLSADQMAWAMNQLLTDKALKDELKEFLVGMHHKGEAVVEIESAIRQMMKFSLPISIPERAVDIVGTGGDGAHTINISTTAAIIASAAGARTVKHGSRAATSKSGAADCLQALGVNIDLDGAEIARTVKELGIGFCFAQKFHSSLRFAAPARKEISVATIFNVLGPLANPAQPKAIALGVANPAMLPVMAQVLLDRGCEGFVFRGDDGLDEISLETTTSVIVIHDGQMRDEKIDPRALGIASSPISALVGGEAEYNADVSRRIFAGEKGAARDAVVLNAAAGIAAFRADFSKSVHEQMSDGIAAAIESIDSGKAKALLENWAQLTQKIVAERPALQQ
jgi:anthranilate phosphoribosyltransferase